MNIFVLKTKYSLLRLFWVLKNSKRVFQTLFSISIISLIALPLFLSVNAVQPTENTDGYTSSNLGDWVGIEGVCGKDTDTLVNGVPIVTEDNGAGNDKWMGVTIAAGANRIMGCSYQMVKSSGEISKERVVAGGVLDVGTVAIGSFYTNPTASFAYQVDQTIQALSPVKTAEAQSLRGAPTGAGILTFVSTLHKSVSNLVYVFYVFVFIIISFTILLKNKINGQEFVNIMNFIPKIIISLVLVVFSYSISGLIIDVANIGMGVVYDIFVNQIEINQNGGVTTVAKAYQGKEFLTQLQPFNQEMSVFRVFGFGNITGGSSSFGANFVQPNLGDNQTLVNGIAGSISTLAGAGVSGINGLLTLILAIGALTSMFKIFFSLLKDFLTLLFYPVLAPIQFALMALPGQEKSAINWFKTMLGSALSFIAMYAVFMLIVYLGRRFFGNVNDSVWNPPLLGFAGTPEIGFVSSLAAYGLYIISPTIPDMVKSAIKIDGSFGKIGSQIAETTRKAASTATFGLIK